MNNRLNQNFFAIAVLLMIIIMSLITQIILNLETNAEIIEDEGIFTIPLLFLILFLILILTIIYQLGPFKDNKIGLKREDISITLLIISMFIFGYIIGPSLSIYNILPNSKITGLIIILVPILMISLMLSTFQKSTKIEVVNDCEE
ncbi:hypothetical protein N8653_04555 [Euryarchaeota archaeon]|nr:hypothetical protein [Euryarchaeota archaeon]